MGESISLSVSNGSIMSIESLRLVSNSLEETVNLGSRHLKKVGTWLIFFDTRELVVFDHFEILFSRD